MSAPRRRAAVVAFFVLLGVLLTWPMAATFTTRLGGDGMDSMQTLWGHWWFHRQVTRLADPFFTDLFYHPFGATEVFQTWSLPDATLALPLWSFMGPYAVENSLVLLGMVTTGLGMYALVRDLTGRTDVALFGGAAYVALPFHLSHLVSQFHLIPIGWVPLYLLFFLRLVRGGGFRDAALGGLCLGLGGLTSYYDIFFSAGLTASVVLHVLCTEPRRLVSRAVLARAAVLGGIALALVGPILVAMLVVARREPIDGGHDPTFWAADLQSYFVPNGRSAWQGLCTLWQGWTANAPENGNWLGYTLLVTALCSLRRSGLARALGVGSLVALILAFGPDLHIGGAVVVSGKMPYAWLVKLAPWLNFSGNPGRFVMVAETSLVIMAALALARTRRRWVVAAVTLLVLVEFWPWRMATTRLPEPAPMKAWAQDPDRFAVLDLSSLGSMMWHSTIHAHPTKGGYLSRTPVRLVREYNADRAVRGFTQRVFIGNVLQVLHQQDIRYVITRDDQQPENETAARLRLPLIWDAEGIRIYRVPGG